MTAALLETQNRLRRSRYARDPGAAPRVLTPSQMRALLTVADFRLVSLPQLLRLHGLSPKGMQRSMRALFDAGLVDVIPVPRALLAGSEDANDATLLYGSAPNLYAPTRAGLKLLHENGMIGEARAGAVYGPKNALFLRHEMQVRDVRVWLLRAAVQRAGGGVLAWHDGVDAAISLDRDQAPKQARPDAWFVLRLGSIGGREAVLTGLVEADRGTERGENRWKDKLQAYGALFVGNQLKAATGYVNARVLVVCPDARRRDGLAALIARRADPALAGRFWLVGRDALNQPDLTRCDWLQAGSALLRPLVPSSG